MLTKVSLLASSLLVALALVPSEANAAPQAKGAQGKPWRFFLESELFGVTHFDRNGGTPMADDEWTAIGFGFARPSFVDGGVLPTDNVPGPANDPLFVYYTRPVISLGIGYAFSKERAIVGAKFALTVDSMDVTERNKVTGVGGRLIPYFQWMFLPGSWVRPYIEARFGFGGTAFVGDTPVGGFPDRKTTVHVIYPQVGFGGGVHLFPVDYFSVDLGLNFDYLAPHTRTTFRDPTPADRETEWDKYGDLINFGVLVGTSVWF